MSDDTTVTCAECGATYDSVAEWVETDPCVAESGDDS